MLSTFGDAGAIDSPAVNNTRAVTAEPAAADAERARLEGAVAGRYRIDALIGRGLFSTVFRATEIRGAAEVAIKLLDAGVRITPEILEHIEAGQRACAALGDEGVVAASSAEQHESATFLVMSLMHGGSLTEVLRSRGPLPLREVVDTVREVAATLDRLHAAGITHRGLTPGSILFSITDISEIFVTFAEPDVVGLSAIAGLLEPVGRGEPHGLHVRLADPADAPIVIRVPIAPGLVADVGVASYERMEPHRSYSLLSGVGSLALDGERELELTPGAEIEFELCAGPVRIDVAWVMAEAAHQRALASGRLEPMLSEAP